MGKYMRKAKTAVRDVSVMDLTLGVRTRAKTLALSQQQQLSGLLSSAAGSGSYLQLRSRRLKKPPVPNHFAKQQKQIGSSNEKNCDEEEQNHSSPADLGLKTGSGVRVSREGNESGRGREEKERSESDGNNQNYNKNLGIESSFGDNNLELEGRERSTRESTPCSLIRDPEAVRTPVSTTTTIATETNRRLQNSFRRHIPTEHEMEEFFSGPEKELQRHFTDKYNFDPVNEKPLPGRYVWEKLDSERQ